MITHRDLEIQRAQTALVRQLLRSLDDAVADLKRAIYAGGASAASREVDELAKSLTFQLTSTGFMPWENLFCEYCLRPLHEHKFAHDGVNLITGAVDARPNCPKHDSGAVARFYLSAKKEMPK